MPCLKCTQPRYCSEVCRSTSWSTYHQFECGGGLDLLHSVGIAHLALRVILVAGLPNLLRFQADASCDKKYRQVFDLVTHVDSLNQQDLFQYTVTSVLLGLYLEQRTKFFQQSLTDNMENLTLTKSSEEKFQYVCSLILRHVLQLVCNAHSIFEVGNCDTDLDDKDGPVVSNNQYRVASAIYPSASMMNHSCDPTVINSFFNQRLIVRAIKSANAGEQIFNCYGPHFRHHSLRFRQDVLKAQYNFVCDCNSCKRKDLVEFQERFSALRCHHCGGPIANPETEAKLDHSMPCLDCGKTQVRFFLNFPVFSNTIWIHVILFFCQ